ncbi:MAG: hypothetical protein AAF589_02595 [Planctomycetota bacterium]
MTFALLVPLVLVFVLVSSLLSTAQQKSLVSGVLVGGTCLATLAFLLLGWIQVRHPPLAPQAEVSTARGEAVVVEGDSSDEEITGEVETDRAFEELTKPRIDLSADAEDVSGEAAEASAESLADGVDAPETGKSNGVAMPIATEPPAWADNPLADWKNGDYVVVFISGPYLTLGECLDDQRRRLVEQARHYVANNVESDDRSAADGPLGMTPSELSERFVAKTSLVSKETSLQDMFVLYTKMVVEPKGGDLLVQRTLAKHRETRLQQVGLVGAGVIGLLGLAFCLLKVDEATKGYYTKRLFIGVPLMIIGLLLLLALTGSRTKVGEAPTSKQVTPANAGTLTL